jgi:NTP pyrophosphatase (non-canonical NTP hydrolase)
MFDLSVLIQELRTFRDQRGWSRFHTPKNLAMALAVESAEVLEHFQWLTEAESANLPADRRAKVGAELCDVLFYLVQLADRLDIDLAAASAHKLADNAARYPAEQVRGSARKYDEY